jgi:hypothetical protein
MSSRCRTDSFGIWRRIRTLDTRYWNLGTPFFPLSESGVDSFSSKAMHGITYQKLSFSEQIRILLAGQHS